MGSLNQDRDEGETEIVESNDDVACYIELNPSQMKDPLGAIDAIPLPVANDDIKLTPMTDPDETAVALLEMGHPHAALTCDDIDKKAGRFARRTRIGLWQTTNEDVTSRPNEPFFKEEHSYANNPHAFDRSFATEEETIDAPESVAIREGNGLVAYRVRGEIDDGMASSANFPIKMEDIDLNDDTPRVEIERNPLLEMMINNSAEPSARSSGRQRKRKAVNRARSSDKPANFKRTRYPDHDYGAARGKQPQGNGQKAIQGREKPFKCNQCLKRFRLSRNLYRHMKLQCNDYSYQCLRCLRGFADQNRLEVHEVLCKQRVYSCFICKDFCDSYKRNLIRHMRIHNRDQ